MLAIAAAGVWLLVFGWCAMVTSRPRLRAGAPEPGPGLAPDKPALVNLSVTQCRLTGAAYPATILDLAASGYLAITEREPGQLWCDVPASAPADTGLAQSERLVLAGVRALAAGDGAPFEALAESCASDVRGRWDPFGRAVWAEGWQAGIIGPRLSVTARTLLYGGAVVVGALAFAAVHRLPGTGLWVPAAIAFFAFIVPGSLVYALGRRDRLTVRGSALSAWADRAVGDTVADLAAAAGTADIGQATGLVAAASPADLRLLAWAVAAGAPVPIPGAIPGLATGVAPERDRAGVRRAISRPFAGTPRPSAAWSSFGGHWRLVRMGPASSTRMHPAFWLVLAPWLALIAYVSSLLSGPVGALVPAVLAVGAVAAAVGGARGLAAWRARPAETSFQAQVIARWVEHCSAADDDPSITRVALDDGERAWSFDVRGAAFGQLALGDMVTARVSPRSGKLLSLVAGQDGTQDAAAPGPPGLAAGDEDRPAAPSSDADRPATAPSDPDRPPAARSDADRPARPASDKDRSGLAAAGDETEPPGASHDETEPPGASGDEAEPGALLAAGEVSAAVGRPVRATGPAARAARTVYRGEGLTIIVAAANGHLGGLTSLARRRGVPLPEVGDEAWLLNRGRTAVVRVGELTAKVTIGGSAARSLPPDALTRLAATVADQLPGHASAHQAQA